MTEITDEAPVMIGSSLERRLKERGQAQPLIEQNPKPRKLSVEDVTIEKYRDVIADLKLQLQKINNELTDLKSRILTEQVQHILTKQENVSLKQRVKELEAQLGIQNKTPEPSNSA